MAISADNLKKVACEAIDAASRDLEVLAKDIWDHPELAYEEHHAHDYLTAFLEARGFPIERKFVVDTGFRSVNSFGSDPNVALLCEYDALPEIGHACGHNLIAEAGVGASLGVKAALEAARHAGNELGTLTVLGTPAEENSGGKIDFIRHWVFDTVTCAMMVHPFPISLQTIPLMANQRVTVRYHGKASHAAGFPWEGVNALDAAVMAYSSISCMRQQMKPNWRISGIITKGGTKPNIIPEETELYFSLRASSVRDLEILRRKTESCFQASANATGCTMEIEWDSRPYANMVTNWTMANIFTTNAESLGLVFNKDPERLVTPVGSSDMGNVSHVTPSIHPGYYIGSAAVNHTRDFTAAAGSADAQPYTLVQAKALAMTAIDLYSNPQALKQTKLEFQNAL